MARPKYCPNCAAPLPDGPRGAQPFSGEPGWIDPGWDCYCDACQAICVAEAKAKYEAAQADAVQAPPSEKPTTSWRPALRKCVPPAPTEEHDAGGGRRVLRKTENLS